MNYSIVFLEKATVDISKAYKHYGELGENLVDKFKEDLEQTLDFIVNNPKHYRKVKRENRQLLMQIFSYVVVCLHNSKREHINHQSFSYD